MFVYDLFKVIVSPLKTFRKILKEPKYAGPILAMVLYVAANVGFNYVFSSRIYSEQTLPSREQLDMWTENNTQWTPTPILNEADYIAGDYYGKRSLDFSTTNGTQVSMQLDVEEPVNCSGPEGFKSLSLRVKLISPTATRPVNSSLFLHSGPRDRFYRDLTGQIISFNGSSWNNITVPASSESENWTASSPSADWGNITGLSLSFSWSENTSATVRIDGLFFRGLFKSELENVLSYVLSAQVYPPGLVRAFMEFTLKWVILSGILYMLAKILRGQMVWKPVLILVGFALITLFVQTLVTTGVYATMPTLHLRLELLARVDGEFESARAEILEQIGLISEVSYYVQMAVYIWIVALCMMILRLVAEFSWAKSAIIAFAAFFISLFAEGLLLLY